MERIDTFNKTRRSKCAGSALLTAVFFTVVKIWDQPMGHLPLEDWVKTVWHIYTVKYYTAFTK